MVLSPLSGFVVSPRVWFDLSLSGTSSLSGSSSLSALILCTGQWADLLLKDLAPLAKKVGFGGLELACWGDHFDVETAAESKEYCKDQWKLLSDNGLTAFAISNHLVGQAILRQYR